MGNKFEQQNKLAKKEILKVQRAIEEKKQLRRYGNAKWEQRACLCKITVSNLKSRVRSIDERLLELERCLGTIPSRV